LLCCPPRSSSQAITCSRVCAGFGHSRRFPAIERCDQLRVLTPRQPNSRLVDYPDVSARRSATRSSSSQPSSIFQLSTIVLNRLRRQPSRSIDSLTSAGKSPESGLRSDRNPTEVIQGLIPNRAASRTQSLHGPFFWRPGAPGPGLTDPSPSLPHWLPRSR
jgi:hypothetical protein